jgi:protein-L-isoaspartate(D-aspartate) O-methyltransferase
LHGGANFGVPQLLMMAAALRKHTLAGVDIVDLDQERALGPLDLRRLLSRGYDLVGISCYSSFDYLKVMAIAARIRELLPRAWLVTGGYHPSARPGDFTLPNSPVDYVVVGDGELPLVRLVQALTNGKRPLMKILGPESVPDPNELVPYDWSLLERYRATARRVASQAEIYLSRGCPYDCAFCMERAKRDVSWRSIEPGQAVEELHRLDRFLDLSFWTLFVADALFGMKRAWRRAFLEELVRRPIRALRIWLLIRVDLIEREDLKLMARANVSPGFGLESGDPEQLKRIRKAGQLHDYLEKMLSVADWARDLDVPFGANIIVGHPGETEASLCTSAAYMRRLFVDHPRGTHGFLSVDPFRLYPGSPIDEERAAWERATGMHLHRYPWWHDGDQAFLSEWVDASATLEFRRTRALSYELFSPIVRAIEPRFAYTGPARDYFMRSVREQIALVEPDQRLRTLGLWHLWQELSRPASTDARESVQSDRELAAVAREARRATLAAAPICEPGPLWDALERVPRERFVRLEHIGASAADVALPLDESGSASISALHAYARAFSALELAAGDTLVELGAGTGYGAALAAEIVGPRGGVRAFEIDPSLASRARRNLARLASVEVVEADAFDVARWSPAAKVSCAFAVETMPLAWLEALAEGGSFVVPVGTGSGQVLTLFRKSFGKVEARQLGPAFFVPARRVTQAELASSAPTRV